MVTATFSRHGSDGTMKVAWCSLCEEKLVKSVRVCENVHVHFYIVCLFQVCFIVTNAQTLCRWFVAAALSLLLLVVGRCFDLQLLLCIFLVPFIFLLIMR